MSVPRVRRYPRLPIVKPPAVFDAWYSEWCSARRVQTTVAGIPVEFDFVNGTVTCPPPSRPVSEENPQ